MSCAPPQLSAGIEAIGLLGPGMNGWPQAQAVLRGSVSYQPQPTLIRTSMTLPPAERRRAVRVVNLALAAAHEATAGVSVDLKSLPTVFASSVGDSTNCHELFQTLATADRQVSPTRFHNSVHNVAAGYWSIATADTASYTMVSAFDGSFAAGLIEALSLVATSDHRVMLVAYDLDYPSPLREKRPITDAFAVALLLQPTAGAGSLSHLACSFSGERVPAMSRSELESLRLSAPAARALPLLELIACGRPGVAGLEYLDELSLSATVSPCS
jgi:beta-ketoacyl synthase-like protein